MSTGRFLDAVAAVVLVFTLGITSVLLYFGQQEDVVEAMAPVREFPYGEVFDRFQVMEVEITVSEEDWADMLANPLAEEYKRCDVTVNGTVYTDAAIRTKGNTSLTQVASSDSDRYSFKIEFDHYDKNKSMDGLDKLVLNNLFCDAAYMKEYIAYDIFRFIGVETPYYAFADITVNGEEAGCYLALEAMEDSFVSRVYGGEGQLYKPESTMTGGGPAGFGAEGGEKPPEEWDGEMPGGMEAPEEWDGEAPGGTETSEKWGGEAPDGMGHGRMGGLGGRNGGFGAGAGSDLVYTDDDRDSYSDIFDNASFDTTEEDEQRVIKALQKLNTGEELERYLDVDACLRYFAAQTFIVNLDSYYSNLKHNYYLYENGGRLTILPWDLNLAFGGFQCRNATEAVNSAVDTPMDGLEEERPLFSKLMEVEEYKERYHGYLAEIAEGYVEGGQFSEVLSAVQGVISPYVEKDATAFYSYREFVQAAGTLEAFVLLRAESVEKQLAGEISSVSGDRSQDTVLVDASGIDLSTMGMQGGDGAGGKGSRDGNMFGGERISGPVTDGIFNSIQVK